MSRYTLDRRCACISPLVLTLLVAAAVPLRADTVITDFNTASIGSYNPRANWLAFGNGTTDQGVHADGSSSNGAYHAVAWAQASWGIGEVLGSAYDLSSYVAVSVDARIVNLGGLTGTALLNFALDMPDGSEYSTPSVTLTGSYQTFVFNLSTLTQMAGSGPLNLATGTPKFIIKKNGQSGTARIDLDQIVARPAFAGFVLTPVILNPPWDGDSVRAMWLYASTSVPRVDTSANAQAMLDFCAREGVNRIYFGGYPIWTGTNTTYKDNLRTFIATAHASGIRVEALLDGTDWQTNPTLVQTRIGQILTFQNATSTTTDNFDAVHFDVEFWLDSSWSGTEANKQQVARNYLDNVLVNARTYLNANGAAAMDVATDLAAHFDTTGWLPSQMLYNGVTQYFIEHVLDHADDVVLMSYYDSAATILSVTSFELDKAAGKSRKIQLGADVQPVPPEVSINSFADNTPTPYSAMTTALQNFHTSLTTSRLAALDGFSVFNYDGYLANTPNPLSQADLNGDGQVTAADFTIFAGYLLGPNVAAASVAKDGDFDRSGAVDLLDFAQFQVCFTGAGAVPSGCER